MALTAEPQVDLADPPPDLGRQAAVELKHRGIDYVLLFDGEPGAAEMRQNAVQWGVREVGEFQGARLYELP